MAERSCVTKMFGQEACRACPKPARVASFSRLHPNPMRVAGAESSQAPQINLSPRTLPAQQQKTPKRQKPPGNRRHPGGNNKQHSNNNKQQRSNIKHRGGNNTHHRCGNVKHQVAKDTKKATEKTEKGTTSWKHPKGNSKHLTQSKPCSNPLCIWVECLSEWPRTPQHVLCAPQKLSSTPFPATCGRMVDSSSGISSSGMVYLAASWFPRRPRTPRSRRNFPQRANCA